MKENVETADKNSCWFLYIFCVTAKKTAKTYYDIER